MEDPLEDGRIPALQLLLGDASGNEKRALLRAAFPDELPGLSIDFSAGLSQVNLQHCRAALAEVVSQANGESPLGASAQKKIQHAADWAKRILDMLLIR